MKNACAGPIRGGLAVALASLLLMGEARADEQGTLPVNVGSRVWLLAPASIEGRVKGTVQHVDDKSITLTMENLTSLAVPRSSITHLEVSTGQKRQWVKGMLIGAIVESAGLAATAQIEQGCSGFSNANGPCFHSRAEALGVGLVAGALVGAAIGALFKTDRWSAVPLEHVRVSLAPTRRGGAQLALSVAF